MEREAKQQGEEKALYASRTHLSKRDRGVIDVKEELIARNHVMQHLKKKVPSTIEFVCMH